MDKAYGTACTLLHHMNCHTIHEAVFSHNTNKRPAKNDGQALLGIQNIVDFFVNLSQKRRDPAARNKSPFYSPASKTQG